MLTNFENSHDHSKKLVNFPFIKQVINGDYDFTSPGKTQDYLKNLAAQIEHFIQAQKITKPLIQRRNGIIKHLTKILTNKFLNAKLTSFGSFESGLSLANGDIDLCLEFDGEPPKKVLKKIARMLNEDGMKDVKLISNAKVPIVKFTDAQSMIPVDISVNNNLSVYNTELLKRYCEFDVRVKPFILAIKYWARNRGICDPVNGTFSSYAWTLIAINFLQCMDIPILPNLSTQDGSRIVTIQGKQYDVSMDSCETVKLPKVNEKSGAEILVDFFAFLANNWPWNKFVVSVREGKMITREKKNWQHKKPFANEIVGSSEDIRLGKHSLPVEDPFDQVRDLSIVLDADGVYEIRDEVLRIHSLMNNSCDWETICEPKYPGIHTGAPRLDLFEDLRSKKDSEVKHELEQLYTSLGLVEKQVSVRESERNEAIRMSKALRKNAELANEQNVLSTELRPRRSKIDELRSKRDATNNNYIPVHFIEEELRKVYANLTEESRSGFELSFEKEKALFSWFFELQSMHEHAKATREYHREFLRLVSQQEKSIDQIKNIRKEIIEVNKLGQYTDFDDLAKRLLYELNPLKKERRQLRREIGRLEAWLKKQQKRSNNNKQYHKSKHNSRKKHENIDIVKSRVASGNSFSLQDLDVLLKNGGLNVVSDKGNRPKSSSKKAKKNQPTVKPHRGKRGKSSKNA